MNEQSIASSNNLSSRIQAAVQSVVRRRVAGEVVPDDVVLSEYSELAEFLPAELAKLRLIEAAERRADALLSTAVSSLASVPTPGRLRIRCPHCREPFETPSDSPLSDFVCESCGGRFYLADSNNEGRRALQQLAHFELGEIIGIGGFGTVWKGYDRELHRTVAVKLPRQERMTTQELEKFLREARAAAQLRHPHIVSVHEVGRAGDTVFIVSDYVDGMSLDNWLVGQQPTIRQAAELCLTIAEALHHAHEHGVIHRDLKPANILIDREGKPHITDFGLARREVGEVTMTVHGQLLGTPAYMSPEQAQGEAHTADQRSDVYSLGVILFQMLTGELPFRGNARMLIKQVIHDDPPSPRKLNNSIPRDLDTVVLKCLEKSSLKRYSTALEVADELKRFLCCQPIRARPIGRIERALRWTMRNKWAATSVGLVGMLVSSAAIAFAYLSYSQRVAARLLREENQKTRDALLDAQTANQQSYRVIADSFQVRGHQLCEGGTLGAGLHHLARALDFAVQSKDESLEELIRYDVGAWSQHLPRLQAVFPHPGAEVRAVACSPDGTRYATGGRDGTVKVWNARSFALERTLSLSGGVMALVWRPQSDGLLAQCLDGTAQCIDLRTAQTAVHAFKYQREMVNDWIPGEALFHPDGETMVIAGAGGNAKRWRWATGDLVSPEYNYGNRDSYCAGLAFVNDAKSLLLIGAEGAAVVRDLETAREFQKPIRTKDQPRCLALFPDQAHLITGYNLGQTLQIWNIRNGVATSEQLEFEGKPLSCAVAKDGRSVAVVGECPYLFVWEFDPNNYANSERLRRVELGCHSWSVAFSPDSSQLLTGGTEYACLWKLPKSQPIWTTSKLAAEAQCVAISPQEDELAVGLWRRYFSEDQGNFIYRFDVKTGAQRTPKLDATYLPGDWVDDVLYDPHGNRLYGVLNTDVGGWDLATGKPVVKIKSSSENHRSIVLDGSGRSLMAYGYSRAELWNTSTRVATIPPFEIGHRSVTSVVRDSDGATFLGFAGSVSQRWEAATGRPLGALIERPYVDASAVILHPSGKSVFIGCTDQTVRHYPITGSSTISPIVKLDEPASHLACSQDGSLIFTNDWGRTSVWHTRTAKRIGPQLNGALPKVISGTDEIIIVRDRRYIECWPLPRPMTATAREVIQDIQKGTGLRLDEHGNIERLNWEAWKDLSP